MNEASQQQLGWAKQVALVYASHPDVRAIILGGSTARGTASDSSDIDLGLFWTKVPSERERSELIRQAGGRLTRSLANDLRYGARNPRRQGCIEIVELRLPSSPLGVGLDLEHETVAGTELVLSQVLEEGDLSLERQELLSVLQNGIALHGHGRVGRWRERASHYPDELALKMVQGQISGIGRRLLAQVGSAQAEDWLCLYGGLLGIGRRLLLSLMGLNRVWAYTDNPDFKGLQPFVDGLEFKPPGFVHRLGLALQAGALDGIRGLADLCEDVLNLVEAHLPGMETLGERAMLRQARHKSVSEGSGHEG